MDTGDVGGYFEGTNDFNFRTVFYNDTSNKWEYVNKRLRRTVFYNHTSDKWEYANRRSGRSVESLDAMRPPTCEPVVRNGRFTHFRGSKMHFFQNIG